MASPESVRPWRPSKTEGWWRVVRFSFTDERGVGHIFTTTVREVACDRGPPNMLAFIRM